MADRCTLTELLVDECAHCQGHKSLEEEVQVQRAQLLASGRGWFAAIYPGTCEACGERFKPGTAIRLGAIRGVIGPGWRAECCAGDW